MQAYVGDYKGAREDLAVYEELSDGQLPPSVLDTRAYVYLKMQAYEEARQDYDTALAAGFESTYPLLGAGVAYARRGVMDRAIELFSDGMARLDGRDEADFDQQLTDLVEWAGNSSSKKKWP